MSKLLTIVIPAYNMHDYLRRCLDSICVESVMDEVQVFIINDGSTDDTSKIAHEYENRYPHYFQVIDKENGNYGSCMNAALPLAKGQYFRTLDADDWYDAQAYIEFIEELHLTSADMVVSEKVNRYADTTKQSRFFRFEHTLPLNRDVSIEEIDWSTPCLKEMMGVMFVTMKTEILHKMSMRWSDNVFYTDFEYIIKPLPFVCTVRLIPVPVYQYFLGRTGQSVEWGVYRKNFYSSFTVTKSVLSHYRKFVEMAQGCRCLCVLKMELLLQNFYQFLFFDGYKYKSEIDIIESMIASDTLLYHITDNFEGFHGYKYVHAYRHNKFVFFMKYIELRVKTNRLLRILMHKD